jgi:hypothetical protein
MDILDSGREFSAIKAAATESRVLQAGLRSPRRHASRRWTSRRASCSTIQRRACGRFIDTCFSTQHLYSAKDLGDTLWTSAGNPDSGVVGWLNTQMYERTGYEVKSQGWTPLIIDANGNGKRDA